MDFFRILSQRNTKVVNPKNPDLDQSTESSSRTGSLDSKYFFRFCQRNKKIRFRIRIFPKEMHPYLLVIIHIWRQSCRNVKCWNGNNLLRCNRNYSVFSQHSLPLITCSSSALHEDEFVRKAIEELLLTKRCILEVDSPLHCCNPLTVVRGKKLRFNYRLESFGKQESRGGGVLPIFGW